MMLQVCARLGQPSERSSLQQVVFPVTYCGWYETVIRYQTAANRLPLQPKEVLFCIGLKAKDLSLVTRTTRRTLSMERVAWIRATLANQPKQKGSYVTTQ